MVLNWKKVAAIALSAVALAVFAPAGTNASSLVTNGDFESNGGPGQLDYNTSATSWNISGGYTFLYSSAANAQDTSGSGVIGQYGLNPLWGTSNGGAGPGVVDSPTGGYFIAQDSDFQPAPLTQTIAGLVAGNSYTVSFDWAATQQYAFYGDNSSGWMVSLGGGAAGDTGLTTIPSTGGTNWMHATFTLIAGSADNLLSFSAYGMPQVPPFALLDGVSLTANTVPEPSTLLSSLLIFGMFGAVWAYKRVKQPAAAV
jgi:hypothetical protein